MGLLEENGVPTHFVEELSDRETVVKKVTIIPLEVIVRNIVAGSMSKRLGIEEGLVLDKPVLEFSYKNDELGDPLINDDHALALKAATEDEIAVIKALALKVNDILTARLKEVGVILVDFKLEFGNSTDGILLADEISPDTCRFWDEKTMDKLDKDRFRRDMQDVGRGYSEISARLGLREA
jgi:phosphoribosylaminoimidazole-succinocarboxamide synthase